MNTALNPEPLARFAPDIDMPVDQGIRYAVLVLRSSGIDTVESCEGGEGHAFAARGKATAPSQ